MPNVLDRLSVAAAFRRRLWLRRHEVAQLARLIDAARNVAGARERAQQAGTAGNRAYANEGYADTATAVIGLCHAVSAAAAAAPPEPRAGRCRQVLGSLKRLSQAVATAVRRLSPRA